MFAVRRGYRDVAFALLSAKCSTAAVTKSTEQTALMLTAMGGDAEVNRKHGVVLLRSEACSE